jgi:hypothetical protein
MTKCGTIKHFQLLKRLIIFNFFYIFLVVSYAIEVLINRQKNRTEEIMKKILFLS